MHVVALTFLLLGAGCSWQPGASVELDPAERAARVSTLVREAQSAMQAFDAPAARETLARAIALEPPDARRGLLELHTAWSVVGQPAPALEVLRWFGDRRMSPSRVRLYVFWEFWDPKARTQLVALSELHQQLASRGVEMIAVCRNTRNATDAQVLSFVEEAKLPFPVARVSMEAGPAYGVTSNPTAALIVDDVVVWRRHPGWLTVEMVETFL